MKIIKNTMMMVGGIGLVISSIVANLLGASLMVMIILKLTDVIQYPWFGGISEISAIGTVLWIGLGTLVVWGLSFVLMIIGDDL